MNMTWMSVLCIVTLIICINSYTYEGFSAHQNIFPFVSPLNKQFSHDYTQQTTTYLMSNYRQLVHPKISSLLTGINNTNSAADMIVLPEMDNNLYKSYKFVAVLSQPSLLLLTPNDSNIIDLGDIRLHKCIVKIAVFTTVEYRMIIDILKYYPNLVSNNAKIIRWMPHMKYGKDYQIMAKLLMPDRVDKIIKVHTEQIPSHLITIININSGDYLVKDTESPFFTEHRYYNKELYDLHKSIQHYPLLSRVGSQKYSLYLPTISCRFNIIAKPKVNRVIIINILTRLERLIKTEHGLTITRKNLSYTYSKLRLHPAARDFYHNMFK